MAAEKFIDVEGLRVRYLEEGEGAPLLLLHGASLGSSADVWSENLPAFAARGFHAIAVDQPGFGLSDNPADYSVNFRQAFVRAFMNALNLQRASLIGHSQSGRMAVGLACEEPRVAKVIVLATGSLLPPLPQGSKSDNAGEGDEGGTSEPTLEDTRKLLEASLFNHALITPAALAMRHRMSTGKNFEAFIARRNSPRPEKEATPLWRRLAEVPVPLLLIYGKQDRGAAAERAALAKQQYPNLNLHVVDRCKHLVQWDSAREFAILSTNFLAA